MKIINKTTGCVIAQSAQMADTALSRLSGLLNRTSLSEGDALIITQCRGIHMLFMRFAIDVIFIDKNNTVVGLVRNIKPFQISPYFFRASYSIELTAGTIDNKGVKLGDIFALEGCDHV